MESMQKVSSGSRSLDALAGLTAAAVVVGSWYSFSRIALDPRALFLLAGLLFLAAGAIRGSGDKQLSMPRTLRVSAPVLLSAVILIMSDHHHRLATPAELIFAAVVATASGLLARLWWDHNPRVAAGIGIGGLAAAVIVPAIALSGSFVPRFRTPDAFVLTSDNRSIPSSSLQGRVVVLAFWASWCGPCREELPQVERAYEHYHGNDRVSFYAVDVDWDGESAEDGRNGYIENHLTMPLVYDTGEVSKQFDVDAIPTLVLMDARGRERFVHRGLSFTENLETGLSNHVQDLLDEEK